MTELSHCPACGESKFFPFLQCIDYTVSHETFTIAKCENCKFAFTNPSPDLSQLGAYYESPSYVSHSATATNAMDRIYMFARTRTMKWKTNLVRKYSSPEATTLLDYGCGTGDFLQASLLSGWNVKGVEPSPTARTTAINQIKQPIYTTIDDLPPSTFDAITLWHVLEHIPDLHPLLQKLHTRLKENGTIFIAVPNRNSWDANHYRETWAAYDVPRHLWHFTKTDMQRITHAHSLHVTQIVPMKLDAYYVSLLSEKYQHPKNPLLPLFYAVFNGLRSNNAASKTGEYSSLIYVIKK